MRSESAWIATCLAAAVSSCSAAPAPPESTLSSGPPPSPVASPAEPGHSPAPVSADHGAEPGAAAQLGADPPAASPTTATASAGPSACPAGMVLVDGDYCTEVEHECLKSWFDKSNKKTVCEEFAPRATCTGKRVKKRYCIDKYSWPNIEGERPEVMNIFYQAQVKCAAAGKRMCTESEWTLACEGPKMLPYPYGFKRDPTKCNGDRPWDGPRMERVAKRDPKELARLWQGVRSGSQPECVSDFGVHDLPGNNDEVVASEQTGSGWKAKYDSVNTGGPWYKGVRNQCRPKIYTHDEGFYYYFLGFRCCAEPDGQATDPRTPRQRADGWKFDRVERYAQFTTDEMREKLRLKAEGKCACKEKDILCKTMCGTLLGPEAKDADLHAPRP